MAADDSKNPNAPDPNPGGSRESRKVAPNVVDQRHQQIDPAGHRRVDRNAIAKPSMKQPGGRHPRAEAVEAAFDRAEREVADAEDKDPPAEGEERF